MADKNKILEENESWLLIDISTKTWPGKSMKIDKAELNAIREAGIGRIYYTPIGYAQCTVDNKTTYVHRVLLPDAKIVDHANHDKLDNRRENLRACTQVENMRNSGIRKNNKSGHRGVSWSKRSKKWQVHIMVKRKSISLGLFADIVDAVNARKEAEHQMFGKYAYQGSEA